MLKVLEITPYEPPLSGWVTRVKLLRRIIEGSGGTCEILDIGPNRTAERPGCIPVYGGRDFLKKVQRYAKKRYTVHCHINGEYFRGMLLAVAALSITLIHDCRRVTTFHAGKDQLFLSGWRKIATWLVYWLAFRLSNAIVCNSVEVRNLLSRYGAIDKIFAIPAFSVQYLEFDRVDLDQDLQQFIARCDVLLSTYLCFRDGFFVDVFIEAAARLLTGTQAVGIVVVGTGDDPANFCDVRTLNRIRDHLYFAGDLSHDQFMTLLEKSAIHVRTPVTDGVSATVLEAMSLGVPVVASDNGARPDGVRTYRKDDPEDLYRQVRSVMGNLEEVRANMPNVAVSDTAQAEVDVLAGNICRHVTMGAE